MTVQQVESGNGGGPKTLVMVPVRVFGAEAELADRFTRECRRLGVEARTVLIPAMLEFLSEHSDASGLRAGEGSLSRESSWVTRKELVELLKGRLGIEVDRRYIYIYRRNWVEGVHYTASEGAGGGKARILYNAPKVWRNFVRLARKRKVYRGEELVRARRLRIAIRRGEMKDAREKAPESYETALLRSLVTVGGWE
jgi:hypothetical protein